MSTLNMTMNVNGGWVLILCKSISKNQESAPLFSIRSKLTLNSMTSSIFVLFFYSQAYNGTPRNQDTESFQFHQVLYVRYPNIMHIFISSLSQLITLFGSLKADANAISPS